MTLATATVTIQALQVNNRQMTMGIFRQLPLGTLLDENCQLVGGWELWGRVNYSAGGDCPEWVVATNRAGALHRCPSRDVLLESKSKSIREDFETAAARLGAWNRCKAIDQAIREYHERRKGGVTKEPFPDDLPRERERLEREHRINPSLHVVSEEELVERVRLCTHYLKCWECYQVSRTALLELPQLFIAV